MEKVAGFFEKTQRFLVVFLVLFLPLIFSSLFLSSFDLTKGLFWVAVILIVFLLSLAKVVFQGQLKFYFGVLDIPLVFLILTYLLSGIIKSPNKAEAFFMPGTASYFVLAGLTFFAVKALFAEKRKALATIIFSSAVLVSVFSLLVISGLMAKIPQLPNYLKDTAFSSFGGKLPEAIFLLITLPLGAFSFIHEKESLKKVFLGAALGVVALNLVLSVYKILPGKPQSPVLNPIGASWSVAIETLKQSPILGVGPGNYLTAFNRFRPISFNQSKFWTAKYNVGSNYLLTAFTEVGVLGLFFFGFIFYSCLKLLRKDHSRTILDYCLYLALGLTFLALILFPLHVTTLLLFMLLLAAVGDSRETVVNLKTNNTGFATSRLPAILITVLLLGVAVYLGVVGQKYVRAEYKFKKSLEAVGRNDAKTAYDLNREAINLTPRVDRYRLSLAQLDIALAKGVAGKKNLTDEDKNLITQLIQQAIAEAKAGTSLNITRSGNWEVLGSIYQAIMPFAQGADNFAIQSFTQAVSLNPMDPNLRISLGGIYYALGRYDEAVTSFQIATALKGDFANAHYNLSAAYREKGDLEKAISSMKTVLTLVKEGTNDYQTAKTELDNLEKRKPTTAKENGESLVSPTKAEPKVINPPVQLPAEANPPQSETE